MIADTPLNKNGKFDTKKKNKTAKTPKKAK